MKTILRGLFLLTGATVLAAAPAYAQCPVFWNGDEPFTHFRDDALGNCEPAEEPQQNGVYPNGFYPRCMHADGSFQTSHGHYEYTHLQTDAAAETEEKDYLDTTSDDSAGQAVRFASNEPERFRRAGDASENPDRGFWQVDEWIGPAGVPGASWSERFFECSGPIPCTEVDGEPSPGGYWSDHRELFQPGFECTAVDADAWTADGDRNEGCGFAFTLCEQFQE